MTTRLYSINPGANEYTITEAAGSAVTTKPIELTVDLAATIVTDKNVTGGQRTISREEVLLALDAFKDYILGNSWPPA